MTRRLRSRFADLPGSVVERCVDDLWACCEHLGCVPDLEIVERLAGERLTGVIKGRPPSELMPGEPMPGEPMPGERMPAQRKVIARAVRTRAAGTRAAGSARA